MKVFKKIVCCLIAFVSLQTMSQNSISFPYFCGFEEDTENANWVVNVDANTNFANLWYVGNATSCSGTKSLYISNDGGVTPAYTATNMTVTSYREFELEAGSYDLAFDWRAYSIDGKSATLYVCWVPDGQTIGSYNNVSDLPRFITKYALSFSSGTGLSTNSTQWQHEVSKLTVKTSGKYKLAFAWNNVKTEGLKPGGCIDNIQISTSNCGKPYDVQAVSKSGVTVVSWKSNVEGSGISYNLKYQKQGDQTEYTYNGIVQNSFTVGGLAPGVYDFWVQTVCSDSTASIWSNFSNVLVYDATCIDFLNLDEARCATANFDHSNEVVGKVDFGYASDASCHTIHLLQDEYDALTGFQLKTVPPDAVASVRLGNRSRGGSIASVSYDYQVDASSASVLLLKYAVVLEDPDHDEANQPRFTLTILNEKGEAVDALCAAADFRVGFGATADWNVYKVSSKIYRWKDWTTVGINLKGYDGQKLTIRLESYGCGFDAHAGYAYFTLSCDEGVVQGINCGDTPTTQFLAPEGFNYRWYKSTQPSKTLSTNRIFDVDPNDKNTYMVDIIYPEEPSCYFTLEASAVPRFPRAEFTYRLNQHQCSNEVSFGNLSRIYTEFGLTDKPVEQVYWDFGNGEISTAYDPIVTYPQRGGDFKVMLVGKLCKGLCTDTVYRTIHIPAIGDVAVKVQKVICENSVYDFFGQILTQSGIYTKTLQTLAGCDSLITLDLQVLPQLKTEIWEVACESSGYEFNGDILTRSGDYVGTFQTESGCDSLVTLHLTIVDDVLIDVADKVTLCADDVEASIPLTIISTGGLNLTFSLEFTDEALAAGWRNATGLKLESDDALHYVMPQQVYPNYYKVKISANNVTCGDSVWHTEFVVNYSSQIVQQKWSDVLALLNANYNGGYTFTQYQWYKDGQPLVGETSSYMYVPTELDAQGAYSVKLTRESDMVTLFTCPVVPNITIPISISATSVMAGDKLTIDVPCDGMITVYNCMGLEFGHHPLSTARNEIIMPKISGIYVVAIRLNDGATQSRQIIVK